MPREKVGCLGFLFGRGNSGSALAARAFPKVQLNKYFVSDAEANFFRVLQRVVGEQGHVLAQVSLLQLLWFPGNNQSNPGRQIWQNKVAAKSVDFVICDPATLRPLVVVELDDRTHARPERQTRDEEVRALLEAAAVPLICVLCDRNYDTREIWAAIGPYLARGRSK